VPDIQVSGSLAALMSEFDIIAHNLANVSTAGYKRRCSSFAEALGTQATDTATQSAEAELSQAVFDFSQGHLVQTDRTLDCALSGEGFFVIETPEGPLYTRHGVFQTNQNGQIVDFAGRVVAGVAGSILVPTDVSPARIHVANDGRVSVGDTFIGQFKLVDFPDNRDQLVPTGVNCFKAPPAVQPVDTDRVLVKQGYQEASNVKLVNELVNMIMVSRLYEANLKLVATSREATRSLLSIAMA
jgi:flagellar basal-body rod protein FlgF